MDESRAAGYSWALRVRWVARDTATVYARNNAFTVGPAASFRANDAYASAVEHLLGALGADLVNGLQKHAAQAGIVVDALELALSGTLADPLVYLGVVGETGEPRLVAIQGTLFVSAEAEDATLAAAWQSTLQRSPIANTLRRSATINIELRRVD